MCPSKERCPDHLVTIPTLHNPPVLQSLAEAGPDKAIGKYASISMPHRGSQKGIAIDQFSAPMAMADITPVMESTQQWPARYNIDCMVVRRFTGVARSRSLLPHPEAPIENPPTSQQSNARKQGNVQINRPLISSKR